MHNKCTWIILKSSPSPVHGKIVFCETGPWCQKGGPLIESISIYLQCLFQGLYSLVLVNLSITEVVHMSQLLQLHNNSWTSHHQPSFSQVYWLVFTLPCKFKNQLLGPMNPVGILSRIALRIQINLERFYTFVILYFPPVRMVCDFI